MFIPTQPWLKWLAAGFGVVSLWFAVPVTVMAEESSIHQVLLAQQSDELEEAKQLNQQAIQLYEQGKYKEAIPIAKQALEIRERILGENHPDVATSLNNLAELYRNQGRYDEAEPLYQRSLLISENALGENHPDVARSLNNLALLYRNQGRYSEAEPLYQRSLAINEKTLGENHPHVALSLNNLATLYRNQGRYSEAEPLYQRSLAIREKTLGENHPDVATSLNSLANLHNLQGRYSEAEPLYQRSIVIWEKTLGENHPHVAQSLNNLAELYRAQGRYSQAEPLYQRSIVISENALGEDHPNVAASLNNLALLYNSQGRYSQAEPLYQRSIVILENALGEEHPNVATSLNNLALLYNSQGRYSEAEPLYQRSLAIREKALGEHHPDVAQSLNNLAELYRKQGGYSQAEPLYQHSLAILKQALGKNHPNVALSFNNLSSFYQAQGDIARTINFLSQALEVEEQNLNIFLATGSERQKQNSMQTLLGTTYGVISLHLQDAPNNSEAANLALTTILRRKARILDTVTNELQLLRENITPENQQLLDELNAIQSQRASLLYNPPKDLPPEQYRQLTEKLTAEAENLEAQLAQRSAEFRVETEPVTIDKLQQLIPQDTALVEVMQYKPFDAKAQQGERYGKPHYAAYIISANSINWVDLGEAEPIDQKVNEFRRDLGEKRTNVENSARELDRMVMQPIREKLGDETHILISPDGQLNLIPFAALMDENNEYLVKNYLFTYLTTGRDLLKLQLDAPSRQDPVMLANPNYDAPGNSTGVQLASTSPRIENCESSPPSPPSVGGSGVQSSLQLSENTTQSPPILGDLGGEGLGQGESSPPSPPSVGGTGVENPSTVTANGVESPPGLGDLGGRGLGAGDLGGEGLGQGESSPPSPPSVGGTGVENPSTVAANGVESPPGLGDLGGQEDNCKPASTTASRGGNQRSTDFTNLSFSPLEGTEIEADAILPIVPNLQLFTGSEATENLLEQLQAPRILHIATHGFFLADVDCMPTTGNRRTPDGGFNIIHNPDFQPDCKPTPSNLENPLLRSGLALAGANPRQSDEEDGILTASEVTRLKLYGTKLVVLSACETGVGSVATGEGVYGLRRAFVKSGAESQLMSLWKVDDYGTSELMSMYYQRIKKGEARSQAMRQVQLELLTAPAYQHPFYWSSFIFSGDWRPMEAF